MQRQFWLAGLGGLVLLGLMGAGALMFPAHEGAARPLQEVVNEVEPNDSWELANPLPVPGIVEGELASLGDTDFFTITVQPGEELSAVLTDYSASVWLTLYDAQARYVTAQSSSTNHRAEIRWTALDARYYLRVTRMVTLTGYLLEVVQIAPTPSPTPTRTPTATPTPSPETPTPPVTPTPAWAKAYDAYEPNNNFDQAPLMAPGVAYELNFVPWIGWPEDYDFFRIRIKRGLIYTCETFDLDNGLDTTLTLYSEPDFNKVLLSNDDRERGDLSSRVAYYSTYSGYMYILVRTAYKLLPEEYLGSSYRLRCSFSAPVVPTPRPTSPATMTPRPTQPPLPSLTPTPGATNAHVALRVVLEARPTEAATLTPEPRALEVLVYVDANQDGQYQEREGVSGLWLQALDPRTNQELAQTTTNAFGQATLLLSGPVRLSLPILGLDWFVKADVTRISVRLTSPVLPQRAP